MTATIFIVYLVVLFGLTFTKVVVVDLVSAGLTQSGGGPSTAAPDNPQANTSTNVTNVTVPTQNNLGIPGIQSIVNLLTNPIVIGLLITIGIMVAAIVSSVSILGSTIKGSSAATVAFCVGVFALLTGPLLILEPWFLVFPVFGSAIFFCYALTGYLLGALTAYQFLSGSSS
jgi:hypothetical protein